MKLQIIVLDFQIPPKAKHWILKAGIPLLLVGAAGIAVAAPDLKTWNSGDTLTAADLNVNFQAVAVPAGTIVAWGGESNSVPTGWLFCDGSAVSRTGAYANLFAAIGINFGGGNGVGTFNVPDLRGMFLRGVDNGVGRDPNAGTRSTSGPGGNTGDKVGSVESESFLSHQHPITDVPHSHGSNGGSFVSQTGGVIAHFNLGANGDFVGQASTASSMTGINHTEPYGGSETRPINTNVNYIIKY